MWDTIAVINQFLKLLFFAAHCYLSYCATFYLFARFMLAPNLFHLAIFDFVSCLNEVDDVLLKNTSFFTRPFHLS